MQSLPYSIEAFKKLNPTYEMDSTVVLSNNSFFSDESINFNFTNLLSGVNDSKINNFTSLFLSGKKKLSDFFTIKPLTTIPKSFSTFFAFLSALIGVILGLWWK